MSAESNDEAVLRMLAGAHFGPDSGVVLPSGKKLDADEAQAWTSVYADDTEQRMKSKVTVTVVCVECEQRWTFRVKKHLEQTCRCGALLVVKVATARGGRRQHISVRTTD